MSSTEQRVSRKSGTVMVMIYEMVMEMAMEMAMAIAIEQSCLYTVLIGFH